MGKAEEGAIDSECGSSVTRVGGLIGRITLADAVDRKVGKVDDS